MEKENRINRYIERIMEELSYENYSGARDLCLRVYNIDEENLNVKYLRDFIESHKKDNGRYEKLNMWEYCLYIRYNTHKITSQKDLTKIKDYLRQLKNEIPFVTYEEYDRMLFIKEAVEKVVEEYEACLSGVIDGKELLEELLTELRKVKESATRAVEKEQARIDREEKDKKIVSATLKICGAIAGIIIFALIIFAIKG